MLKVNPVRAFADNYIWLIQGEQPSAALVVDPGDARPVLSWCQDKGIALKAILITHHHGDHVGGIRELLRIFPGIPVYGPRRERIPAMTHPLGEGDEVIFADMQLSFSVMDVPGHTAGHIAYLGHGCLFCGDTVFANGCGRVFDGTFEQLCHSLERIAKLPPQTRLYCAHEYTVDNIGFAKWVEPDNPDLQQRDELEMERSERGIPTVPSILALELKTNPFLRFMLPQIKAVAEEKAGRALRDNCEVFSVLRRWKDSEYD
jgi:hydroxyacylglutathione hydrolase